MPLLFKTKFLALIIVKILYLAPRSKIHTNMFRQQKNLLFFFFFVSGFCSLLYQVVWLRLAFAAFGIVTPVISVLISVFMAGLFVGSWLGGKWIKTLTKKTRLSPIFFYGLAEVTIGIGGLVVSYLFAKGETFLLTQGEMDSLNYMVLSGVLIFFSILPWCICMGATFPFMMQYVKIKKVIDESGFSYLYLANVIGAMCGTVGTAVMFIELLGFRNTLLLAALSNFLIAGLSFVLASRHKVESNEADLEIESSETIEKQSEILPTATKSTIFFILFLTGFASMAMEVVWIRAFTPIIYTKIYAFALLLTVYLFATWVGSYWYRKHRAKNKMLSIEKIMAWLAVSALLPLLMNDPRLNPLKVTALLSIFPFCLLLGYLTPMLIDVYSKGFANKVGKAYAINILGCIIGPLIAGYLLLPTIGTKWALLILAIPFALWLLFNLKKLSGNQKIIMASSFVLVAICGLVIKTFEDPTIYKNAEVRRDYTATVISEGEGMKKRLLVNGVGITYVTTITKFMAHLPLAYASKSDSSLVICFGMGTTYRSLLSWGEHVTAVELVPSVRDAFEFYHADAPEVLQNKKGKIVIDDGRRYIKRTNEKFDVITIDPPPPVEAAGSSLLYSREFYTLIKMRLNPDGVLHAWTPGEDAETDYAIARSLAESFPYVKVFRSFRNWGFHFIASQVPIKDLTAQELFNKMPAKAKMDLMEWESGKDTLQFLEAMLDKEVPMSEVLKSDKSIMITDDRPYNEYFLLRRFPEYVHGVIGKIKN
jgi:spermidine synthase